MKDRQSSKKPLGQILIEAGIISISQIEIALQEQKYNDLRIGEIIVLHGWTKQETVDFFAERWSKLSQEEKKPLAYYFQEAGLLDMKQINAILRLQKLKQNKVRFHRLAVEQGYLKQITVDCFVAHILNTRDSNTIALAKIYEILESYTQGEKDFQGIELCKAPLMGVSFQGIKLDRANLTKADLTRADLSHSSFVEANLDRANLTKAIFTGVDFSKSKLTGANFRDARLEKTNFQSAVLEGVDFRGAYLAKANFAGANLKKAMLPLHYTYEVYYDRDTFFDSDFDPKFMGWKIMK
ncbi:pentapeptide repeat-containing protein [Waterburya agarophytonicola K14]|uniref:Pentapeptide repeat-containing protein n=1 Tax=Waterburya agarophytonicola KI4 TaxID=2874699 RepID=A0A964FG67_9CYAN|nr:pentapeptide repeat-containing protein [Waterburya agarophytonicola]MCC0177671.1 pentapeptide repeat-containing protein [Waterburya agarophytonicola KI4]